MTINARREVSYTVRTDLLPSQEHEFVSWGSFWTKETYDDYPHYMIGRGFFEVVDEGCVWCDVPEPPHYEPVEYEMLIAVPRLDKRFRP